MIFVNTDFSCLATFSPNYSFVPLWQPPFISKLVPEDRCHLNGLAMVEGKPAYMTACSATDTAAGWRNHRRDGGVVISVEQNEIIATGLSMPHSPRWYKGKLWLLCSGTGELGYIDLENGQFVPITFCPGFVRGLAFWQNWAVVGLSKLRSGHFSGLALEERLNASGNTAQCGLMVIDLTTGQIVEWLHIGQTVEELFDIVILPNVRQPEALGLQGDEVQRLVRFPNSGGIVTTKPTVKRPSIGKSAPVAGLPQTSEQPRQAKPVAIKYQRVYHLNSSNALDYDDLTYPSLQQRWQHKPPKGELLGISASIEGSIVGFAIAERVSGETAELISLLVLPNYRRQGIGTKLLVYLERELTQQGTQQLILTYQNTSLTQVALEPILQKLQWQTPESNGEFRQTQKWLGSTPPLNNRVQTPTISVSDKQQLTVEYHALQNLTVEQSIAYNDLTFPKVQTRWSRQQPKGQLVGILATVSGEKVGLVLAEVCPPAPNPGGGRTQSDYSPPAPNPGGGRTQSDSIPPASNPGGARPRSDSNFSAPNPGGTGTQSPPNLPPELGVTGAGDLGGQRQNFAEVISLFVLPNYRHQGIGTGLMQNLEAGLTALGCTQMKLVYKSSPTTTLALEPLLKQQNWRSPQVNFLLGKTTTEKLSQAPWVGKYPLPNKFTVFPWSELTDADQQQMERLDYPASLSPFSNTPAEPLNSLGLRYDGQLVGWMVTHRVASDAIRYSVMFVEKRFQRLGRGISLLSESILRQVNSSVPYCLFAVAEDNPAMLQFVHRHLEPFLIDVTDSRVAVKQLSC